MIEVSNITADVVTDSEFDVTGSGVFDVLMNTVNAHIKAQFDADRIQSSDIANMYIGIMPSVLAISKEFVLEQELTEERIATEKLGQQALKAKTEDENGMIITEDSIAYSSSPETQHYWAVKTAEEGYEKAEFDTDAAEEGVESIKAANRITEAKLNLDYNKKVDPIDDNILVDYSTIPTSTALDTTWLTNKIPETNFELALLKARTEATVASQTAEGYKADGYYKIYRSLQELLFALVNGNLVSDENSDLLKNILTGMEDSMNEQANTWGDSSLGIDLNVSTGSSD